MWEDLKWAFNLHPCASSEEAGSRCAEGLSRPAQGAWAWRGECIGEGGAVLNIKGPTMIETRGSPLPLSQRAIAERSGHPGCSLVARPVSWNKSGLANVCSGRQSHH